MVTLNHIITRKILRISIKYCYYFSPFKWPFAGVWVSTKYCYYFSPFKWPFAGVWVSTNILSSPRLFWVFKPILTMLWPGGSRFFLLFPITPVFLPSIWRPFQEHQPQLRPPSISCSAFFFRSLSMSYYLILLFYSFGSFSHQRLLVASKWNFQSQQVSPSL